MKLEFSEQIFEKKLKYQVLSKSVQWDPSSMQAGGRTDMTKLIVAFRNFADAPKKYGKRQIVRMSLNVFLCSRNKRCQL